VHDDKPNEEKHVAHHYMALRVVYEGKIHFISVPFVLFAWYCSVDNVHNGSSRKKISYA
jgi:hypothetical protein